MIFKKQYGLFRQHLQTNVIEGYIENIFSMGWSSEHVRVWEKYTEPNYYLKKHLTGDKMYCGTDYKQYKYFIVRFSQHPSKIKIFLHKRGTSKFLRRNALFVVNGF